MLRARPVLLNRGQAAVCVHMTCAAAIPQLADRIADIGVFVFLVWAGLVVTRVAAGTIRLECRVSPCYDFSVRLVAIRTLLRAAMIQRLVRRSRVAEIVR